ncbi:fasciclin domain-containing protein [Phenylobacterium sp.]|jgi:uncharacterized surface protein with fasciclin (FAS1) repeats|uniref:fasciclin domain-containing protein n=1 Tax=Phenylobacterium sp. TaxID=1871053 RepID=UPI002E307D8D|nr:fasciclin domain-containing protein [Phenylobacterium sp.]HEX2558876.1 fasciclin domain-containing protein [Phenylobacterium sp.]
MKRTSLLTAAAAFALVAGAASAQSTSTQRATPATPATPAQPAAKTPGAPATPATPATRATPATPSPSASAAPAAGQVKAAGDIVETARAAGQFSTFLKAVEATNLTQVLKTNKGLTVFAPTDAAFAALPPGELDRLMQPGNRGQLQKVLTYHLINAKVDSSKIKGAKGPVPTVAGANVELDGSGEALKVNNATIVQADVTPTNGTLHVIDKVLLPPAAATASAAPTGAATSASSTAPAASGSAAGTASTGASSTAVEGTVTGSASDAGATARTRSSDGAPANTTAGDDE